MSAKKTKKREDIKLIKEIKIIQKPIGFGIFLIRGSKKIVNDDIRTIRKAKDRVGYFPAKATI